MLSMQQHPDYLTGFEVYRHGVQVLREAQTRMQQAPPPPGSSSPQKASGLGTMGDATRKEFEVTSYPTPPSAAACTVPSHFRMNAVWSSYTICMS